DRQLHPESIDDAGIDRQLADLESLRMDLATVFQKYPPPQVVVRRLGLRPEQANQARPMANPAGMTGGAAPRESFQKIMAYYRDNGLKNVNALRLELQAQKLIRAVSSQRQPQDVMVTFWLNHINVCWPKNPVRASPRQ